MTDRKKQDEERQRQVLLIHQLATRLPWILVGVFLFAFLLIFLQVYLMRG